MIILAFLSVLVISIFIAISFSKFSVLDCYSDYYYPWKDAVQISNMNLWSIITFVFSILMLIPMIDAGEGNKVQFLGFLTPIYLISVALVPDYLSNRTNHILHSTFAYTCAVCAILWQILVTHTWYMILASAALLFISAIITKTLKKENITLWLELLMFLSVPLSLIVFFI